MARKIRKTISNDTNSEEAKRQKMLNVVELQNIRINELHDEYISTDEFEEALAFSAQKVTTIFNSIIPHIRKKHPTLESSVLLLIEQKLAQARNEIANIELPEKAQSDITDEEMDVDLDNPFSKDRDD